VVEKYNRYNKKFHQVLQKMKHFLSTHIIIIIITLLPGCQTATAKKSEKYNTIGYIVYRLKEQETKVI